MHPGLNFSRRSALTTGVAAVAVLFAGSGAALAGGRPYTVNVKVKPSIVTLQGSFTVTATGVSDNLSQLRVFLNGTRKCATTAAADASNPGDSLKISTRVVGTYSKAKTLIAVNQGRHYACAYLTAPASAKVTRAHASTSYAASLGFY